MQITDKQAMELLKSIDIVARDYDGQDYGLPIHQTTKATEARLIDEVKNFVSKVSGENDDVMCHDKQHSGWWEMIDGKLICVECKYGTRACLLCHLQVQLEKVRDITEDLPETGSDLYDDAVTDVFNAADNARHLLEHEHGEE